MMAVLLAKSNNALPLRAISVCKTMPPHLPPSKEISCVESTGSLTASGKSMVAKKVSVGLVIPMAMTTRSIALPATRLRGSFIVGESWEILSRPEKARKEPAKPTSKEKGVRLWLANMRGIKDTISVKERWENTVTRIARSLKKAMEAATRLTLALSPMPIQFNRPSRNSIAMVIPRRSPWTDPTPGRVMSSQCACPGVKRLSGHRHDTTSLRKAMRHFGVFEHQQDKSEQSKSNKQASQPLNSNTAEGRVGFSAVLAHAPTGHHQSCGLLLPVCS